jgi:hypothetical protein
MFLTDIINRRSIIVISKNVLLGLMLVLFSEIKASSPDLLEEASSPAAGSSQQKKDARTRMAERRAALRIARTPTKALIYDAQKKKKKLKNQQPH